MMTLLEQFLAEAREALTAIDGTLIALEAQPQDGQLITGLFRLVHTLKGNCGLFDFPEMIRLLHAAEDVMEAMRAGQMAYRAELADRLLAAMDLVGRLCDCAEREQPADAALAAEALESARLLRALLGQCEAGATPDAGAAAPAATPPMPAMPAAAWLAARAAASRGEHPRLVIYRPDAQCFFSGEDPLHRAMGVPGLLWGSMQEREPWPELAELDPFRCNLDFYMISRAGEDELAEHFRYVPEQWQHWLLPAPPRVSGQPALAAMLAAQREILALPGVATAQDGRLEAVQQVLAACLHEAGHDAQQESLAAALASCRQSGQSGPLLAWLAQVFPGAPQPADAAPPAEADGPSAAAGTEGGAARVLRVEQGKIDRLMELIGEVVVAKNAIPYLAARAEQVFAVPALAREIEAQYGVIKRIAEEMQDAIMQVRMMPVSFIFQRFPRLVRDLSRRLGKEVRLEISGQETAADKNIIEGLADPLLHILRNSLDHGFEDAASRIAAGKPACGTLSVAARQEGDRVCITIRDDGRGIDPVAIRRSACAKGLIDEASAARLSDQEAVNLVFAPGFSTAAAVSDISGRGVGMDVVRNAVQKVQGTLTLESRAGAGTCISLSLPLSMAVTQVLTIETDGQRFGVPMDAVRETVRVPLQSVRRIKQRQVVTLRGCVLPLLALNEVLGLSAPPRLNAEQELAVLVLGEGDSRVGLLVDQFHQAVSIILKPLAGMLGGLALYSGSALMGDGSVLMVLNPKEIF
ncbi:chemotaxis protein CheA [Duganella qianjiadongensis]|uniref:histidine kinase n=1 Tax=Duganella qianjiadongensis TaxID=2692176 RepID=A0ABW9VJV3_9BURK|nr:chemotaxis protein CheA [Duganella qianjiadongensis]MYM39195.1 chemotaxis protein CheA [Duganella qianjiadongensis]